MKIIEVRDGFIKIESENKVGVSSFLEIKGTEKRYIAQTIRSRYNGAGYSVYAKILFVYDGAFNKYDKTLPPTNAEVSVFPFSIVNNSFNYNKPIVAGKFAAEGNEILISSDCFDNATLMSIDNPETNNILISNLSNQFRQKERVLIIDMLGIYNGDKYVAGRDFKLPLNTESLKFLYDDCLGDATNESKDLVKEIFADLAEYSKEVNFLPFNTLKMVVDDMVEKSHIFKLLVLKNKLAKFESAGYFASKKQDAENLSGILKSDFAVIDLSKVDGLFQNRYLSVILSELGKQNLKTRLFLEASNAINKKNIKASLYSESIKTTFVTHSKFKYLADLKSIFKNYFIENSSSNKEVFKLYYFFIESMGANNYLYVGEGSNYIPLISNIEKLDVQLKKLPQDNIMEEVTETSYDSEIVEEQPTTPINEIFEPNKVSANETIVSEPMPAETIENPAIEETTEEDNNIQQEDYAQDQQIEESESIFNDDEDKHEEVEEGPIISETETDNEEPDNTEDSSYEDNNDEIINEPLDTYEELPQADEQEEITEELNIETVDENEYQPEEIAEEYSEPDSTEVATEEYQTENVDVPDSLVEDINEIESNNNNPEAEFEELVDTQESMSFAEPKIIPLGDQEFSIGEFSELDISEAESDDILVDISDDDMQIDDTEALISSDNQEDIEKSIIEDVDKVYTSVKDENISDADLDLIDKLNEFESPEGLNDERETSSEEEEVFSSDDMETLESLVSNEDEDETEGFLAPLDEISDAKDSEPEKEILERRESNTPIVPVYEADIPEEDRVVSDDIEQGDTVIHAKYGSGVVEKMIKYGNKNLYSINFDNVGRRLLDPTLTEIKKA